MELKFNIFETMALVTAVYYLGKYLRTKIKFVLYTSPGSWRTSVCYNNINIKVN